MKKKSVEEDIKKIEDRVLGGVETEESPSITNQQKINLNEDDGEYKINVIKDYYGAIDITFLNKKDPNYEYRWLNSRPEILSIKTSNTRS